MKPIVETIALTRVYKLPLSEVTGIDDVTLRIDSGAFVILKGNSGSGKTTLLSILSGLDRPTSGCVTVAGQSLAAFSQAQLTNFRRNTVGIVFQAFNLLPTLSVQENVCLPALFAGRTEKATRKKADELLDWLGLEARASHMPSQLSGGEMQRVAIARALINDPALILADEPTGNLDSKNGEKVIHLLGELSRESGRTVILATHSNLADKDATMAILLRDGRVIEQTCKV